MSGNYSEVQNFWDFNKGYYECASNEVEFTCLEAESASMGAVWPLEESKYGRCMAVRRKQIWALYGPYTVPYGDHENYFTSFTDVQPLAISPKQYCRKYFHAQNCKTHCDDLCEIQNMDPCRKIWTDLSEKCCQTCDSFVASCEVDECLIQLTTSSNDDNTALVPTASPLTAYTISLSNGKNEDCPDSESFYVLVTLLPICGFIGRGCF